MADKNKVAMQRVETAEAEEALHGDRHTVAAAIQSPKSGIGKNDQRFFDFHDERRLNDFNEAYIEFLNQIDSMEKLLSNRMHSIAEFKRTLLRGKT